MAHLKNGYWHIYVNGVEKIIEIGIDWGHGPGTPGKETPFIEVLGRKIQEEEFNIPAAKELARQLNAAGFKTYFTAAESYDVPLTTRANRANARAVTIIVSIHFNAMGVTFGYSTAKGFSAHIQEGSTNSSNAYKLAKLFIEELAKGTPQTNRGIVKQNLAITRQTNMPAVLLELGFMDDPIECMLMLNTNFHKEVGQEGTAAICRYFGVAPPKAGTIVAVGKRDYWMKGDIAAEIGTLQTNLNKVLKTKLTVDNIYGQATEDAVKKFQLSVGLEDDGVFGKGSRSAMNLKLAELSTPKPPKPPTQKPKEEPKVPAPTPAWKVEFDKQYSDAKKLGITDGTRPKDPVTREEAAVMNVRAVEAAVEKVLAELKK